MTLKPDKILTDKWTFANVAGSSARFRPGVSESCGFTHSAVVLIQMYRLTDLFSGHAHCKNSRNSLKYLKIAKYWPIKRIDDDYRKMMSYYGKMRWKMYYLVLRQILERDAFRLGLCDGSSGEIVCGVPFLPCPPLHESKLNNTPQCITRAYIAQNIACATDLISKIKRAVLTTAFQLNMSEASTMWGKKTALVYFYNTFIKSLSIPIIPGTHMLQ